MIIKIDAAERRINLLALLLNWSVITGIVETMSRLPSFSFFSGISRITLLFSFIFILLSVLFTIGDPGNQPSYLVIIIWAYMFPVSLILEPRISTIAARAFAYYTNNIFCLAVLVQSVPDFKLLLSKLRKYVPLAVVYALLQWVVGAGDGVYSMSFSYGIMVPTLLCLLLTCQEKEHKVYNLTVFTVLLATHFKYGSRGSIVCCFLAVLLSYFYSKRDKQIEYFILILLFAGVISSNWAYIIAFLSKLFPESRNLFLLSKGLVFYVSGRDVIYEKLLKQIIAHPFAIRGLYSDRVLLAGNTQSVDTIWGAYSHNIILELLYQWGIWCIPFIALVSGLMIRMLVIFKRASSDLKIMIMLVYAYAIGQLMVSSSYLIGPSFGLLLGLLLWFRRNSSRFNYITESYSGVTE